MQRENEREAARFSAEADQRSSSDYDAHRGELRPDGTVAARWRYRVRAETASATCASTRSRVAAATSGSSLVENLVGLIPMVGPKIQQWMPFTALRWVGGRERPAQPGLVILEEPLTGQSR